MKRCGVALICVGIVALSAGCTRKAEPESLRLAVWAHYLAPGVIEEFSKKTGIPVQVSHYASNEELLAKLQAGGGGYDLAVPSDYMVFVMIKLGLLEPVGRASLQNWKNLDPAFLGRAFDRENQWSVPLHWGTTGIARNKKRVTKSVLSWKDLLSRPELKGEFSLLDDAREALGAALKAQGFSLNARKPEEIRKAQALLQEASRRIRGFSGETKPALVAGEVGVAQAYSSDALQAAEATRGEVEYVLPEEGGTLWLDSLVIPKGARNPAAARALMDFLLDPQVAVRTVQKMWLGTTNRAAIAVLPEAWLKNPGLFPPEALRKRLEMMEDLGPEAVAYDRAWTEIKAGSQ